MSPMEKLEEIVRALEKQTAALARRDGLGEITDEQDEAIQRRVAGLMRALTLARELRDNSTTGWVFFGGFDGSMQDAHNFYEQEPENHDGPALIVSDPNP